MIRLRWMSNFTDADALAAEPGVRVRFTRSPADIERADLRDGHDAQGHIPNRGITEVGIFALESIIQ